MTNATTAVNILNYYTLKNNLRGKPSRKINGELSRNNNNFKIITVKHTDSTFRNYCSNNH